MSSSYRHCDTVSDHHHPVQADTQKHQRVFRSLLLKLQHWNREKHLIYEDQLFSEDGESKQSNKRSWVLLCDHVLVYTSSFQFEISCSILRNSCVYCWNYSNASCKNHIKTMFCTEREGWGFNRGLAARLCPRSQREADVAETTCRDLQLRLRH